MTIDRGEVFVNADRAQLLRRVDKVDFLRENAYLREFLVLVGAYVQTLFALAHQIKKAHPFQGALVPRASLAQAPTTSATVMSSTEKVKLAVALFARLAIGAPLGLLQKNGRFGSSERQARMGAM